jgi:hypothetical protein
LIRIGSLLFVLLLPSCGGSEVSEVERVTSPDGKAVAIESYGANPVVVENDNWVRLKANPASGPATDIFHGDGGDCVIMRWLSNQKLVVMFDSGRVLKTVSQWRGSDGSPVAVSFQHFSPSYPIDPKACDGGE